MSVFSVASASAFEAFFDFSLTGGILYEPVYAAGGDLVDFTFFRLNQVAQRLLELPPQPSGTYLAQFPAAQHRAFFAKMRQAFLHDTPLEWEGNYQTEGRDNFYHVAMQRAGKHLVVNFSTLTDQPRLVAEEALRQSQTREQAAHAEANYQRSELQRVLEQAPVAIALLRGPQHLVEYANAQMGQLWGRPLGLLLGQPHFEALPDLAGQGFEAVFDHVFQTGETQHFRALNVAIGQRAQPYQGYFNITYQPAYDSQGQITGLIASAVEVTDQVLARQQVQALNEELATANEELAATNEELRATNEEFLTTNASLSETQLLLQLLNQELEGRVALRTREAQWARAEAERQRGRLEDLFRRAPAAICIFDGPAWVYEFVNPSYQAMFPGRQLLGLPLLEALPEVAGQPLVAILQAVYDTGVPFEGQAVLVPLARTASGPVEDRYFDLTYLARYDADGQIDGFITYAQDVTEQVLARHGREVQDQRLRELFEQAPVSIFVLRGASYLLEIVNTPMCQLLGRLSAQLVGRPYFEAVPELATQGYKELLDEVWRTGQAHAAQESAGQLSHHRPGETGYFNFVYQPLRDEQGQVTGIICVAVEVTEQVHSRKQVQELNEELVAINEELTITNEELNNTNTQLTRTNVDLDTFVYTASHDLKAPITNIEGILLALRHHLAPAVQQQEIVQQLLDLLQRTVERFRLTISQLTDVSKLQLAHAGPTEAVNLAAVVADVHLDLLPTLEVAGTQLTVEIAPDVVVFFAPANLRSVVYNLLSNASKYRDPARPSVVRVRAVATAQAVVLTVQDNGLGLTPHQQERLFGLFQRLHTHVEGTGVGLYIIKRLVENAAGTITVESTAGVGSTFTVTFRAPTQ